MDRLPFNLVLLALAAMATAGCRQQPQDADTITIGVSPFQDTILPKLGVQHGWYKDAGLNVRFVTLGWTEINEALSAPAGRGVDIAINNECGVISAHAHNPNIVYYYGVNPFDNGFALMVRPHSPLHPLSQFLSSGSDRATAIAQTAAQLRGRTVITTSNTDMEQGVAAAAAKAGLKLGTDVKIINLPPEDGLAAFLSGKGDAYIGGVPQRLAALRAGDEELLTGADLGPPPINGFVTTKQFLAAHPNLMPKVMKVWFQTVQYIDSHPQQAPSEVSELLQSEGVKLTPTEFIANWNKVESFPSSPTEAAAQILAPTGRNYWKRRWDSCNDYYTNVVHAIPKPVDPQGVFLMNEAQPDVVRAVGQ